MSKCRSRWRFDNSYDGFHGMDKTGDLKPTYKGDLNDHCSLNYNIQCKSLVFSNIYFGTIAFERGLWVRRRAIFIRCSQMFTDSCYYSHHTKLVRKGFKLGLMWIMLWSNRLNEGRKVILRWFCYGVAIVLLLPFHRNLSSNAVKFLPEGVFASMTDLTEL